MVSNEFTTLTRLTTIIIAVVLSIGIIFTINTYGGKIEGYFFPVAVADEIKFQVVEMDQTVLNGTMKKMRECEFLGLRAYLTDVAGLRIVVPLQVGETLKLRPPGDHGWGPWIVQLPLWSARNEMEIVVLHRCTRLYVTETVFWNKTFKNEVF